MDPIQGPNPNGAMARLLEMYNKQAEKSLERLASGNRINRASDDPVGLISSEGFRAILATLEAEAKMLQRSDQVSTVADGALGEVTGLLNEAERLLHANANSAGVSDEERQANQMQLDSIISTVNRIADSTRFNGTPLFDGNMTLTANGTSLHIDRLHADELGSVELEDGSYALGDLASGGALNIVSGDLAEAQETLAAAREQITSLRGRVGSFQKHTIGARLGEIGRTMEQTAAANSQIRDTDYAHETAELARSQVLKEIVVRIAAMTNSDAKNVLNLLG